MRILHICSPGASREHGVSEPVHPESLALLPHRVVRARLDGALVQAPEADVVVFDAVNDLARCPRIVSHLRTLGIEAPVLAVIGESGLVAASPSWGVADVLLPTAGPAEVDARLRLAAAAPSAAEDGGTEATPGVHTFGDLSLSEESFTATVRGRTVDLTFKEFELLRFFVQNPGRAFTRDRLLQDVWDRDDFGGTRTVDVHVRRLRAKLGPEHEALIATVRNVGYRFDPVPLTDSEEDPADA